MLTQGERQDFKWRPNDFSSTTTARYDQEAENWYRAFKNAEAKNRPADYSGAIEVIGLVISLALHLLILVVLLVTKFIRWLWK